MMSYIRKVCKTYVCGCYYIDAREANIPLTCPKHIRQVQATSVLGVDQEPGFFPFATTTATSPNSQPATVV